MHKLVVKCGFMLFGMFFGAGNLVFSLKIGQSVESNWICGFLGLILSDVVLSFFGLFFVLKRHNGDGASFFGEVGPLAKSVLPFLALSLLGPFGVAPRCVAVAYGGVSLLIPSVPLWAFSAIFCAASFFVALNERRSINVIGKWMTPILLISMFALFVIGVARSEELTAASLSSVESFREGFVTGYQTMDLLLAFFSAAMIFSSIREALPSGASNDEAVKIAVKSSVLASLLLLLTYFCMVFLGSHYSGILVGTKPSSILIVITNFVAGDYAAALIALITALACFTSAAPLNAAYARYVCSAFKLGEDRFPLLLFGTAAMSFLISLSDFGGIIKFLSPTLDALYPSIVVLTAASVFLKRRYLFKKVLFYGILIAVLLNKIGIF